MFDKVKEKLKEKMHIIVMTILTVYLIALAVKTAQVFYTEYWVKEHPPTQIAQKAASEKPSQ